MAAILIIAEDSSVIRFLREVLESDGHQIYAGEPGTAPADLRATSNFRFDILIADAPQTDPTGCETAEGLSQAMPGMPVIVLSDSPYPGGIPPKWRLLVKPFRARALLDLVAEIGPRPS